MYGPLPTTGFSTLIYLIIGVGAIVVGKVLTMLGRK